MAKLFPDAYFHIGGDENNGKQWNENKLIQTFMKKNKIPDNHSLQAFFNNRILKILTRCGKKMIGWDEILHPQMPTNIVIQSWRGKDALVQTTRKGYMGILSNGYYIDLMQTAESHYLNDPVPADSELTAEEKSRILGGEATMWAELVTPETIDSRIWPRTAAIAERYWSPAWVKDVDDMYRRLDIINSRLEELGITSIKNQDMMLRRLTNDNDIISLRTFVDAIEPLKNYDRHGQGVIYTQQSPYTRVVDAALPESKTAREFKKLVAVFLEKKNPDVTEKTKQWLTTWQSNHEKLSGIIKLSPILKEIESMSLNLSKISQIGLEAIEKILSDKKGDIAWYAKNLNLLNTARKSYGQVELVIVPSIEKLVIAATIFK
jgi:hexosaminidase